MILDIRRRRLVIRIPRLRRLAVLWVSCWVLFGALPSQAATWTPIQYTYSWYEVTGTGSKSADALADDEGNVSANVQATSIVPYGVVAGAYTGFTVGGAHVVAFAGDSTTFSFGPGTHTLTSTLTLTEATVTSSACGPELYGQIHSCGANIHFVLQAYLYDGSGAYPQDHRNIVTPGTYQTSITFTSATGGSLKVDSYLRLRAQLAGAGNASAGAAGAISSITIS